MFKPTINAGSALRRLGNLPSGGRLNRGRPREQARLLHMYRAELKALIKDRLRSSRVPDKVAFVDELPYNEMGKLLRRQVRGLFVA